MTIDGLWQNVGIKMKIIDNKRKNILHSIAKHALQSLNMNVELLIK